MASADARQSPTALNPLSDNMSIHTEPAQRASGRVPAWQPDEAASKCPLCHQSFSTFFRRHHCRKCGRVVCGHCSARAIKYLATTYVVSPPSQIYLESPLVPHRTCDECAHELEMIQRALEPLGSATEPAAIESRALMVQNVSHIQEDLTRCPVCETLLVQLPQIEQERHIDSCLSQVGASPQSRAHNRTIIYRLSEKETVDLGECTVCFEDFLPGQNVGRLECLCLFHEECIIGWFQRKGAGKCPVHNH